MWSALYPFILLLILVRLDILWSVHGILLSCSLSSLYNYYYGV